MQLKVISAPGVARSPAGNQRKTEPKRTTESSRELEKIPTFRDRAAYRKLMVKDQWEPNNQRWWPQSGHQHRRRGQVERSAGRQQTARVCSSKLEKSSGESCDRGAFVRRSPFFNLLRRSFWTNKRLYGRRDLRSSDEKQTDPASFKYTGSSARTAKNRRIRFQENLDSRWHPLGIDRWLIAKHSTDFAPTAIRNDLQSLQCKP